MRGEGSKVRDGNVTSNAKTRSSTAPVGKAVLRQHLACIRCEVQRGIVTKFNVHIC